MTSLEYKGSQRGQKGVRNTSPDGGVRKSGRISDRESTPGVAIIAPNNKDSIRNASLRHASSSRASQSPFIPGRNTMSKAHAKALFEPVKQASFYGRSTGGPSSSSHTSYSYDDMETRIQGSPTKTRLKGKGKEVSRDEDEERESDAEVTIASTQDRAQWEKAAKSKTETAEDIRSFSDIEAKGLPVAGPSELKRKRTAGMKDRNGKVAGAADTSILLPGSKTAVNSSPVILPVAEAILDGHPFPITSLTISSHKDILFAVKPRSEWRCQFQELIVKLPRANIKEPGQLVGFTLSRAQANSLVRIQQRHFPTFQGDSVNLMLKLDSEDQGQLKKSYEIIRHKHPKDIEALEPHSLEAIWKTGYRRRNAESSSPDPLSMPARPERLRQMLPTLQKDSDDVQIMDTPPIPPSRAPSKAGIRRSNRRSGANAENPEEVSGDFELLPRASDRCADPDKLLFKYPFDGRGGVTITDGDRDRMRNDEYLNDTLIEFGLKIIYAELSAEEQQRIHIFNSFFYKKLSGGRSMKRRRSNEDNSRMVDHWEGYEAVRKWTVKNKVDIFEKDLVIVPINEHLHWYLAVIYKPKGILNEAPALDPSSTPLKRTRAQVAGGTEADSTPPVTPAVVSTPVSPPSRPMLGSLTGTIRRMNESTSNKSELSISPEIEEDIPEMPPGQAVLSSGVADKFEEMQIQPTTIDVEDDDDEAVPLETRTTKRNAHGRAGSVTPPPLPQVEQGVLPKKPKKVLERKKIWGHEGAWILVFDSLGSKHPSVGRNLRKWLEYEAREKRGVVYPLTPAEHFDVKSSLTQSNTWDCGVYALHTAERIMKHPEQAISFSEKPRPFGSADRKWQDECTRVWNADDVQTKRGEWTMRIDSLKVKYAQEMATKLEGGDPPPVTSAPIESSILPDDEKVEHLPGLATLGLPGVDPTASDATRAREDSKECDLVTRQEADGQAAIASGEAIPRQADKAPGQEFIEESQRLDAASRKRLIDTSRENKIEEESPDPEAPSIPSMEIDHDELREDDAVSEELLGRDVTISWSKSPSHPASQSKSTSEEKETVELPSSRATSAVMPDLAAPAIRSSPSPSHDLQPPAKRAKNGSNSSPRTSMVVELAAQGRRVGRGHKSRLPKRRDGTAEEPVVIDITDEE